MVSPQILPEDSILLAPLGRKLNHMVSPLVCINFSLKIGQFWKQEKTLRLSYKLDHSGNIKNLLDD